MIIIVVVQGFPLGHQPAYWHHSWLRCIADRTCVSGCGVDCMWKVRLRVLVLLFIDFQMPVFRFQNFSDLSKQPVWSSPSMVDEYGALHIVSSHSFAVWSERSTVYARILVYGRFLVPYCEQLPPGAVLGTRQRVLYQLLVWKVQWTRQCWLYQLLSRAVQ